MPRRELTTHAAIYRHGNPDWSRIDKKIEQHQEKSQHAAQRQAYRQEVFQANGEEARVGASPLDSHLSPKSSEEKI